MKLSKRDKIVHLLNRFGLGANEPEIEYYAQLGVDGAIDHLVNYQKVPNRFEVKPWEFVFDPDGNVALDPGRFGLYWCLRMICTGRPMEEKMTLFWHNHFAVSGAKVEFGPMMHEYVDVMRAQCLGNFHSLLESVSKTAAMVHWLDADTSLKGKPNENFARELMELFTLGIGHYTEQDVQHAARAFSGWNIRYAFYEMNKMKDGEKVRFAVENDMPMAPFQDSPGLHDNSVKTVLGVTAPHTAEGILKMAAYSPATARRMSKKLWEFFVYQNPEPQVIDRIAKVWTESNLDIKATMLAIANSPEFWSEKAVGTMVKSPVDFLIGAFRQVGAGPSILAGRKEGLAYDAPIDRDVINKMYGVFGTMANLGLTLLFPPDVSGWRWGPAWASSSGSLDRVRANDFVMGYNPKGSIAKSLHQRLVRDGHKITTDQFVDLLLSVLAVDMKQEKKDLLIKLATQMSGPGAIKDEPTAAYFCWRLGKFIFGSPEYQLC